MNVIDTNIWIYSHDIRDPQKQATAQQLIQSVAPLALLWQVGCEFVAASRKLKPFGFSEDDAWNSLADMQAMSDVILIPAPELWPHSRALKGKHGLQFWDALLIACCIREGVETLFSEDFSEHAEIDGLKIVNPFAP
jgi:predicted nucleic acid-binding protein